MSYSKIKAPIRFYDVNPAGRILNRFSQDMQQMDELLPENIEFTLFIFLKCLGVIIINAWTNWISIIIAIPTFIGPWKKNKLPFEFWDIR